MVGRGEHRLPAQGRSASGRAVLLHLWFLPAFLLLSPHIAKPPGSPVPGGGQSPRSFLDGILSSCGLYKIFCLTLSTFCLKSIAIHGQILDFFLFLFLLLNRKRSLSEVAQKKKKIKLFPGGGGS